jgi:hypothetical protein
VEVRFEVGPVPADLARAWLTNARQIADALRATPERAPVVLDQAAMALADVFLDVWTHAASSGDTFHWTSFVDPEDARQVAEQWRLAASITDEQMAALGCSWASPETEPFFDALVAGFVAALSAAADTEPYAADLAEHPPGDRGSS